MNNPPRIRRETKEGRGREEKKRGRRQECT
jgi:hypothetical protein